ncbi:19066_t:CDS:2, partial [Gigaspora rosea]
ALRFLFDKSFGGFCHFRWVLWWFFVVFWSVFGRLSVFFLVSPSVAFVIFGGFFSGFSSFFSHFLV